MDGEIHSSQQDLEIVDESTDSSGLHLDSERNRSGTFRSIVVQDPRSVVQRRVDTTPIHFPGRVVAQLVRAGEVPRRSLVRAPGRRIEGYLISRSRVRFSPALPACSGAHGRWPRATGHRSSTAFHRARRRRTSTHGPRGRGGVETRRRDAGATPAGPGSTSHL